MALGHLWKNTDHGSGVVGNEGAQFGAGAQEDPVSCQKFHALEQMQDLQKVLTGGSTCSAIKK